MTMAGMTNEELPMGKTKVTRRSVTSGHDPDVGADTKQDASARFSRVVKRGKVDAADTLYQRALQDVFLTRFGPLLISLNPGKPVEQISQEDLVERYHPTTVRTTQEGISFLSDQPHIFDVCTQIYNGLVLGQPLQVIEHTGETTIFVILVVTRWHTAHRGTLRVISPVSLESFGALGIPPHAIVVSLGSCAACRICKSACIRSSPKKHVYVIMIPHVQDGETVVGESDGDGDGDGNGDGDGDGDGDGGKVVGDGVKDTGGNFIYVLESNLRLDGKSSKIQNLRLERDLTLGVSPFEQEGTPSREKQQDQEPSTFTHQASFNLGEEYAFEHFSNHESYDPSPEKQLDKMETPHTPSPEISSVKAVNDSLQSPSIVIMQPLSSVETTSQDGKSDTKKRKLSFGSSSNQDKISPTVTMTTRRRRQVLLGTRYLLEMANETVGKSLRKNQRDAMEHDQHMSHTLERLEQLEEMIQLEKRKMTQSQFDSRSAEDRLNREREEVKRLKVENPSLYETVEREKRMMVEMSTRLKELEQSRLVHEERQIKELEQLRLIHEERQNELRRELGTVRSSMRDMTEISEGRLEWIKKGFKVGSESESESGSVADRMISWLTDGKKMLDLAAVQDLDLSLAAETLFQRAKAGHFLTTFGPLYISLNPGTRIQLIECFGNASTRLSDNSSRFASSVTITFDTRNPSEPLPTQVEIDVFAWEKTCVIVPRVAESNFHLLESFALSKNLSLPRSKSKSDSTALPQLSSPSWTRISTLLALFFDHEEVSQIEFILDNILDLLIEQDPRGILVAGYMYETLFSSVVRKVNEALGANTTPPSQNGKVMLVDSPGFELVDHMALDQFLYNTYGEVTGIQGSGLEDLSEALVELQSEIDPIAHLDTSDPATLTVKHFAATVR
ncbi:hypothetical protein TREMEDRAFT_65260 [Tremella mesenterica DSM 1558]|uniref:uncharacterized protein n=1 Tax=Tremella mesenterica (strain ATCC 24925 / CBS 8224 / DSM 1558 / NBRC 9311 / NRRL Y-6157 / RJB 2259-6 / UBC 559-6) TaxID=578456 RepID=UPI00032C3269|nr:uncharacterized protein TREMEDRAFT_65260 [Tremella mesenterica DSM 1558]EIW66852.1 hypothetical protein TREMEDRAFT_65260 [Tremella mesenterica DSM 1558]